MNTETQNPAPEAYRCNVYGVDNSGQPLLLAVFPATQSQNTAEVQGQTAVTQFLHFYDGLRGPYTYEVVPAEMPASTDAPYYRVALSVRNADGTRTSGRGGIVVSDYGREETVVKSNHVLNAALASAFRPLENGHYCIEIEAGSK